MIQKESEIPPTVTTAELRIEQYCHPQTVMHFPTESRGENNVALQIRHWSSSQPNQRAASLPSIKDSNFTVDTLTASVNAFGNSADPGLPIAIKLSSSRPSVSD